MSTCQRVSISVVIPTYNSEAYLAKTLDTLTCQLLPDDQVIIVDDRSSDSTVEIVKRYVDKHENFSYQLNKGIGPNTARNQGINSATSDYILFLDSDDYLSCDALSILKSYVTQYFPDVIVYGYNFRRSQAGLISKTCKPALQYLLSKTEILELGFRSSVYGSVCWNKLVSTELLRNNNIYFIPDKVHGRDSVFSKEIALTANSVLTVPDLIYTSIIREGSFSRSFNFVNISSALNVADHIHALDVALQFKAYSVYNLFAHILFLSYCRQERSDYLCAYDALHSWLAGHKYIGMSLRFFLTNRLWKSLFFLSPKLSPYLNIVIFKLLLKFTSFSDY